MLNETNTVIRRTIRSFVRREGRMTAGQKVALADLWPKFGLEPDCILDFPSIFDRKAPVWLEIGFGMGEALIDLAKAHPEYNFIGIEVYQPGVGVLLRAVEEEGVENIRVISKDAVGLLEQYIANESLAAILIFFPDPWPKRKHHKRRLIQPKFIDLLASKLTDHGKIHLATDWEHYAKQMIGVVTDSETLYNPHGSMQFSPRPDFRPLTKFEKRGKRLGHNVWDIEVQKVFEKES